MDAAHHAPSHAYDQGMSDPFDDLLGEGPGDDTHSQFMERVKDGATVFDQLGKYDSFSDMATAVARLDEKTLKWALTASVVMFKYAQSEDDDMRTWMQGTSSDS